ncbi:MAG: calcium/sodium antiporter [Balneolaceae bacterium]
MVYLLFAVGLILLLAGAEFLVSSSSKVAVRYGFSPILIGITIVAFATSAPEIAVSVGAALADQSTIAIGNVLGSNVANILLILGLSALLAPVTISKRIIRLDIPLMIGITLIVYLLSLDGAISRIDGIILLLVFVAFMVLQVKQARKEKNAADIEEIKPTSKPLWYQILWFLLGLTLLVVGADFLVDNGVLIARTWGMSELVIGLTIIAIGTSLPEVATSVLASYKGEQDLSVGNVIGSNIFNLLLVLGISSVISSNGLIVPESSIVFDFPFLIAVSVACIPIFFTGFEIARWEGGVFIAYYVAYLLYLILESTQHDLLEGFSLVMGVFVIPITVLTILVLVFRFWKRKKK